MPWIPFKSAGIYANGDVVRYRKTEFKVWKSRPLDGKIKCGSFNQDSKGNWFVCITCELECGKKIRSGVDVGVDLGLKTIATLSDGTTLNRGSITTKYESKLASAQRAKKKKQVTKIHSKIKNSRMDWSHKETTKIVNKFDSIAVGDIKPSNLKKTRMAKSVSDAGWFNFKSMLKYKAAALGVDYREVKENFSTVTCSTCFERTGPRGLSALGVREWVCKCGATHDRDVNAAKNILRFGYESPKGATMKVEIPRDSPVRNPQLQ